MTEIEKKAEEYQTQISLGIDYSDFEEYNKAVNIFVHSIKKAYKDGYEQGQKDKHQTVCDGCVDYGMLQKENAELKEEIARCNEWLSVLEKENPDNFVWKKDCLGTIKRSYLEENAELKEKLNVIDNFIQKLYSELSF